MKIIKYFANDTCKYLGMPKNMTWVVNNWNFKRNNVYSTIDSNANDLTRDDLPFVWKSYGNTFWFIHDIIMLSSSLSHCELNRDDDK